MLSCSIDKRAPHDPAIFGILQDRDPVRRDAGMAVYWEDAKPGYWKDPRVALVDKRKLYAAWYWINGRWVWR